MTRTNCMIVSALKWGFGFISMLALSLGGFALLWIFNANADFQALKTTVEQLATDKAADHRQDDNQKENPKGKSAERRQNDKPEKEKNLAKKNKTKKDKTKVEETAIKQAETTIPAPTPVVERDPGRTPSGGRRT